GHGVFAGEVGLALATRLEVAVGVLRHLGHCVELVQVHRVSALGTGGHVGDLPLAADVADRDGTRAVRVGTRTDRHAVGRRRGCFGTQCDRVAAAGVAVVADRGAEHPGGRGAVAERRTALATGAGADQAEEGGAADRGALRTGGLRVLTHRRAAAAAGGGRRAHRRIVVTRRDGAVAERRGQEAVRLGEAAERGGSVRTGVAAVADRRRLGTVGDRRGAVGEAEGAVALCTGAERNRAHLVGLGRPPFEDNFAGELIDDVELAAHGDAGVARCRRVAAAGNRVVPGRRRAIAVRGGELAAGEGPTAEGGGAGRERIASGTDRRGVVGAGIGIRAGGRGVLAVDEGFAVAGRLEVAGVLGRLFQLRQVHRVGAFRARGDIDDLPLAAGVADRNGIGAVRIGVGA